MTMLDPLEVDFQCYILFCFVIIAFLREYGKRRFVTCGLHVIFLSVTTFTGELAQIFHLRI